MEVSVLLPMLDIKEGGIALTIELGYEENAE